jgi:hypothetical protein
MDGFKTQNANSHERVRHVQIPLIPSTIAVPSTGLSGEHPAQRCVVGLNCVLIPSTTAVPSAGLSGEHPAQSCVVGLNCHDGVLMPSTTAVPSAGLSEEIFRRIDWITVKLHVFLCNIILNPDEIKYIIKTILFAIYDYASLVAQL